MCIIAAKPAGVKMPDTETIRRMWYANRDGAGFMYAADGKVRIRKGFMKLTDFEAALSEAMKTTDFTAAPVVLHFRITTHGGTKPSNCHPFPVTRSIKNLQALTSYASIGIAHNGIIPIRPRNGISDTMEYIATQLAPLASALPDFTGNPYALELIENAIQSKMCFLSDKGEITTVGDFINEDGVLYSNGSYKAYGHGSSRYFWGDDFVYCPPKSSKSGKKTASKGSKTQPRKKTAAPVKKPLQWALYLPNGSFGMDYDSDELIDDLTDLLIDEDGKAYMYDALKDAARPAPGIRLYTAEGMNAKFDPDLAELEYVTDDETDMPFRC